MMPSTMKSVLLLLPLFLASCAPTPAVEKKPGPPPDVVPVPLAPNTCQFSGTITEILPVEKSARPGPCASVPCLALVRVDRVLGYGSAFGTPIAAGAILRIRFPFTLAPTPQLFPGTRDLPPTLTKGERLTGTLTSSDVPSTGEQTIEYSLTTYSRTTLPEGVR